MRRAIPLGLLLALVMVGSAQAATFTVMRADDPAAGACDTDCSLREAVLAANTAAGDDTVVLRDLAHLVSLGEIPVAANGRLTVVGEGADETTIDAGGLSRIFLGAPNADLTISSMTLRGARAAGSGGAVQLNAPGTLTITDSSFEANSSVNGSGGAVQLSSPGTLVILRSSFSGNSAPLAEGGALQTNSDVTTTISDSTFSGNRSLGNAGRGGAIQVNGGLGPFTVTNSTFSGNLAQGTGAGQGGAIAFNAPKLVTLSNVTIAGNNATGGASSGGGIQANLPATITLRNTIIANNTASTGANCSNPFTTAGFNLESADTCGLGAAELRNRNPLLGQLGDYGGPTATMALLPGSPALNAGNPALGVCAFPDQRGVPRPQGSACEIGAYELARCRGVVVNRVGTAAADTLLGTGAADGFMALGGNDTAQGGKGKDGVCGNGGNDVLRGGPGADLLKGGAGKDRLFGQGGADKLSGGGRKDRCVGGKGKDRAKGCERVRSVP